MTEEKTVIEVNEEKIGDEASASAVSEPKQPTVQLILSAVSAGLIVVAVLAYAMGWFIRPLQMIPLINLFVIIINYALVFITDISVFGGFALGIGSLVWALITKKKISSAPDFAKKADALSTLKLAMTLSIIAIASAAVIWLVGILITLFDLAVIAVVIGLMIALIFVGA